MKPREFLLLFGAILAFAGCGGSASASSPSGSHKVVCYQPCVVTLRGKLETTWTYGPPNFGDPHTDKKIPIFLLVMSHAIDVPTSGPFEAAKGVTEIQLYFPDRKLMVKKGVRIAVVGELRGAVTAMDIYPVVMQVSSVRVER